MRNKRKYFTKNIGAVKESANGIPEQSIIYRFEEHGRSYGTT